MGKALGPWSTLRYTTYIQRLLQIYINGTHVKLQTDIRDTICFRETYQLSRLMCGYLKNDHFIRFPVIRQTNQVV